MTWSSFLGDQEKTNTITITKINEKKTYTVANRNDLERTLVIEHPNPHRDTRLARKLANGHYLVCHEGDGCVREYDGDGKVVWSYVLDLAGRPEITETAGQKPADVSHTAHPFPEAWPCCSGVPD